MSLRKLYKNKTDCFSDLLTSKEGNKSYKHKHQQSEYVTVSESSKKVMELRFPHEYNRWKKELLLYLGTHPESAQAILTGIPYDWEATKPLRSDMVNERMFSHAEGRIVELVVPWGNIHDRVYERDLRKWDDKVKLYKETLVDRYNLIIESISRSLRDKISDYDKKRFEAIISEGDVLGLWKIVAEFTSRSTYNSMLHLRKQLQKYKFDRNLHSFEEFNNEWNNKLEDLTHAGAILLDREKSDIYYNAVKRDTHCTMALSSLIGNEDEEDKPNITVMQNKLKRTLRTILSTCDDSSDESEEDEDSTDMKKISDRFLQDEYDEDEVKAFLSKITEVLSKNVVAGSKRKSYEDYICHACGKPGHISRNCFKIKPVCDKCGRTGHLEKFCYNNSKQKSRPVKKDDGSRFHKAASITVEEESDDYSDVSDDRSVDLRNSSGECMNKESV